MGKDELSLMLFCVLTGIIIIFLNYNQIFIKDDKQKTFGTTVLDSIDKTQNIENIEPVHQRHYVYTSSTIPDDESVKIYEISTMDFMNIISDKEEIIEPSSPPEKRTTEKQSIEQTPMPTMVYLRKSPKVISENMILVPAGEVIYKNITVFVQDFYIDKYEVTISEYQKFDPSYVPPEKFNNPNMPVTNISYTMASNYAKSIGKRLPTEVEWIRAARGNSNKDYAFGDYFSMDKSRVGLNWESGPAVVGSYLPNIFGIYDMTGNVWEWVATNYINPKSPGKRIYFILKGGSWYYSQENSKIDNIRVERFDFSSIDIGFRCALDYN